MRRNKHITPWLFLLPSLTGITVFVLLPFLDVVRRSFYDAMNNNFVGLSNYRTVLTNGAFRQAISNTARFILVCLPLLLFISLVLALLIHSRKKYRDFYKTSLLIPMAIPTASMVILWKLIFHENGLINGMLLQLGGDKTDFMNTDTAFTILVFSYLWKNAGYDMILWLTGLNGIDTSLYEAAGADGAGAFQRFRYITLPLLSPALFMIGILSFVNSFKVFREAYLISGNYPQESIYMLQHIFNNWFAALDTQKMCAAAVLSVFLFMAVILLILRFDKE